MSRSGAEFRKTDLQIHSPRDRGWDGARPEDSLGQSPTPEQVKETRQAYCKTFLKKCAEKGIRAIAITDHHEGVYAYEAIEALKALEGAGTPLDLWVFPGMELTCKDSCQALIIFDADLSQPLFNKVCSKLNLPADIKPFEKKGIEVELLAFNLEDLQGLLDVDNELRGRFIILPHVKPGGHKTVLRTGFQKRFKDMPYVGGYMDQTYPDDLNAGDRRILDGEIPAWSSEKRGVVSCSDARHADFRLIGSHATWIKMASPTAESLRQAMLAPDSRIRYSEPILPSVVISSITVTGATHIADGTYYFNQQMNSIIGGRGAGKSTLLEYARFALGCSAIDDVDSEGTARSRMKELLVGTLDKVHGEVTLEILLHGAPVKLTRAMAKEYVIRVISEGTENFSNVDQVRTLISTQQYRQGELADLARIDAEKRLFSLVTAQAREQLSENEEDLKKNGKEISEALAKAVKLSAAQQLQALATTQSQLLKVQIENLRKSLSVGGQAPSAEITAHDTYLQQQSSLAASRKLIEENKELYLRMFGFLKGNLDEVSKGQPLIKNFAALKLFYETMASAFNDENGTLKPRTDGVLLWFDEAQELLEAAEAEWKGVLDEHNKKYDEQKAQLAGKQSILESIEQLSAKLQQASKSLEDATTELALLIGSDEKLEKLRTERLDEVERLFKLVQEQVALVPTVSSGLASGNVAAIPDLTEVQGALRQALGVPNMREARLESLADGIKDADDKFARWQAIQTEVLEIIKWKEGVPEEKGAPPATPLLHEALGEGFMAKVYESLSVEAVAIILRAILRPRVELFHIRDSKPIEFRKASQGEQAATLLNILMNQSNGPLIIDQPEEDLDNKIIGEIIRTIRKTKDQRQLILATHNANITVNGDSEHVIEMVLGKQAHAGAIDEPAVMTAITETMEGGKDAFELRRKKYNF